MPAGIGAVRFQGPAAAGIAAALSLRSAARVIWELAADLPGTLEPLFAAIAVIDWPAHLPSGVRWAVRVSGTNDALRNTAFSARFTKDAIRAAFERRALTMPEVDPRDPEITVDLRIHPRGVAIGIDLLGSALHRRGFERRTKAPIREDVAAGLAILAEVDAEKPLLDPFCGSGTLLLEAASVALRIPPHRPLERTALLHVPQLRAANPRRIAADLLAGVREPAAPIVGFEAARDQIENARWVAREQGLAEIIELRTGRTPELELPEFAGTGLVLTNPPWGRWLDEDVEAAWLALGRLAREKLGGWKLAVLSGAPELTKALRMKAARRFPVRIGTVDAKLLLYEVLPPRVG